MELAWTAKILVWLRWGIVIVPLLFSMFVLYYLGKHEIWIPNTPYRDLMTIFVLIVGMTSSFFLPTFFSNWKKFDSTKVF